MNNSEPMPEEIFLADDRPHEGYWASCEKSDGFCHRYIKADTDLNAEIIPAQDVSAVGKASSLGCEGYTATCQCKSGSGGQDTHPEKAVKLWQLLDDIDTLDDACKSNDRTFRDLVRKVQRKRFEIMSGEALVKADSRPEIEGLYRALKETNEHLRGTCDERWNDLYSRNYDALEAAKRYAGVE